MVRGAGRGEGRFGAGSPLGRVLRVVERHLGLAVGVPAALVVGTAVFVLVTAPVYEAAASLRIDEGRPNVAVLEMLRTLSGGGQVDTELEELRSRTLAEEVVDSLDLDVRVEVPGRVPRRRIFPFLAAWPDTLGAEYVFRREGEGVYRVTGRYPVAKGEADRGGRWAWRRTVTRDLGQVRVGERVRVDGLTLELGPEAAGHSKLVVVQLPFHEAVDALRRRVAVVRPVREASMLVVRYQGGDPELVQAVPNLLARRFIARRRAVERAEAGGAVAFLGEEVDRVAQQLGAAEEALRAFRERNRVLAPAAEADAQVKRLVELKAERDRVDAERGALARLLAEVEGAGAARVPGAPVAGLEAGVGVAPSPYRRLLGFPTLLRNPAASELLRVLAELENQRSSLLIRRTLEDPDVKVLTARIGEVEEQLRSVAVTYLGGLAKQVASLDGVLGAFQAEVRGLPAKDVAFARLSREAEVLSEIYGLLRTRLEEAEIAAALEEVRIRVVDPAAYPRKAVRPRPILSLVLAVLLGTVLGVGAAFAREYTDTRVRTREELERAAGVAVLGAIGRLDPVRGGGWRGAWWRREGGRRAAAGAGAAGSPLLLGDGAGAHPLGEAFRALRGRLWPGREHAGPRSVVVTSAGAGAGKSTAAVNLAVVAAQQGRRVVLVDGDLRGGTLHELLGQPGEPGLGEVLEGSVSLDGTVRCTSLGAGRALDFLAAGRMAGDAGALLDSPLAAEVLQSLGRRYDVVIVDAPALDMAADAAVLGAQADGVLLVVRAGGEDGARIAGAVEELRAAGARLLGAVLNGADARDGAWLAGLRSGGARGGRGGGGLQDR